MTKKSDPSSRKQLFHELAQRRTKQSNSNEDSTIGSFPCGRTDGNCGDLPSSSKQNSQKETSIGRSRRLGLDQNYILARNNPESKPGGKDLSRAISPLSITSQNQLNCGKISQEKKEAIPWELSTHQRVLRELLETNLLQKEHQESFRCHLPNMLQKEICCLKQSLKPLPQSELFTAVMERNWPRALLCVRFNPDMCRYQSSRGFYPLHGACYIGSCPSNVFFNILEAYPEAVSLRNSYPDGNTPLHTLATNCQGTSSKMKVLLRDANARLRDHSGNTVLHLACQFNAMIDVLQDLITKDVSLLDIQNYNGETPLGLLWRCFLLNIPGHLAVSRILRGKKYEPPPHFKRFWEKVKLLVLKGRTEQDGHLLGHFMLQYRVSPKMLHLAIKLDRFLVLHPDGDGDYLIHKMLLQKITFDRSVLKDICSSKALEARNHSGETVLSLALKMKMLDYVEFLIEVAPELLVYRDIETKLYPFQLASALGCPTETIFPLLTSRPEVMKYCDR